MTVGEKEWEWGRENEREWKRMIEDDGVRESQQTWQISKKNANMWIEMSESYRERNW